MLIVLVSNGHTVFINFSQVVNLSVKFNHHWKKFNLFLFKLDLEKTKSKSRLLKPIVLLFLFLIVLPQSEDCVGDELQ